MAVVKPPWESDPIEYLVRKKFPALTLASRPSLNRTTLGTVTLAELELSKNVEAYRQSLKAMPESDLMSLAAETARKAAQAAQEAREAEERNYFFNRPARLPTFAIGPQPPIGRWTRPPLFHSARTRGSLHGKPYPPFRRFRLSRANLPIVGSY